MIDPIKKREYGIIANVFRSFWLYEKEIDESIRFYTDFAFWIPQAERNEMILYWNTEKLNMQNLLQRFGNEVGSNLESVQEWLDVNARPVMQLHPNAYSSYVIRDKAFNPLFSYPLALKPKS